MKRFLLLAAVAAAGCSRVEEAEKRKCLALRVGMPEAELFQEMGKPNETLGGGNLITYIYGHRLREDSLATVNVDGETRKVKNVSCGDSPVRNFYTEKDAEDFRDGENGEKPEGRAILSRVGSDLAELNRRSQRGKPPAAAALLEAVLPDRSFPELAIKHHESTRSYDNFEGDVCRLEGLNWPKFDASKLKDSGHWGYVVEGPCAGRVFVDCTHMADRDRRWYQVR